MSTIGIDIRLIGKKQTGSEAVFFNLVKNLSEIDSKNKYFLFTDIQDQKKLQSIEKDLTINNKKNFRIISLPAKNKFAWNFWTLPRYLGRNPVDVYLTQYITPFFVSRKVKITTIIHDISFRVYPEYIKKSDLFFLNWLIPMSLKRADKIVGVSKFTQDEIKKYYTVDPKKVDWIHNAVSEKLARKKMETTREEIDQVLTKHTLPKKYVLYIGTLQPRKNLPTLIEAYAKIKNQLNDVKLVLAGGKGHNYDTRIDDLIKKYGLEKDVFFPGYIPEEEKPALMLGASIFCFPSLYEGFGIPILEAMTLGVTVAASDIPPHREIAKETIYFFNPNNSDNLAQKLIDVYDNPAKTSELTNLAFQQSQNFSWKSTAQKMLDILEKTAIDETRENK